MKRIILLAVAAAALMTGGIVATGIAAPPPGGPPGHSECGHGNSGKPCKEDPQPERGKDCEEHGRGGVNEDHCAGEPQPPTEPPVTEPPVTEPPVTEPPVVQPPVTPGEETTVEVQPGSPPVVEGPAEVVETTPGTKTKPPTVTVVATKPGVIRVKQKGKTTAAIGVVQSRVKPLAG